MLHVANLCNTASCPFPNEQSRRSSLLFSRRSATTTATLATSSFKNRCALFFASCVCFFSVEPATFAQDWQITGAPTNLDWKYICASADGMRVYGLAFNDTIYVSTNYGSTFSPSAAPSSTWFQAASSLDGRKLAAVVYDGGIYISHDFGMTWSQTSAPWKDWTTVTSSADGVQLIAASPDGSVYVSRDSGTNWIPTSAPTNGWYTAASSYDGKTVVIAANRGPIYISRDYGTNWTATTAPTQYWHSIACSADGSVFVAEGLPTVFVSTDNGTNWVSKINHGYNSGDVACSADGSRMASVDLGGLVNISSDFGATWNSTLITNPLNCVTCSADGTRVLIGYNSAGPILLGVTAPKMAVTLNAGNLTLSWPAANGFALQSALDLSAPTWGTISNGITQTNYRNYFSSGTQAPYGFFRLSTGN